MAQLPRRRAPHLIGLVAALGLLAAPAAAAAELDLTGVWHVLVHYKNAKTANPDADRWEDRVWELEASGSRLRWTEFPIVVFDDEAGRFENASGNRNSRVIQAWDPSPEQLANIRAGLAVNDRGSQTKSLRRQGSGWSSLNRASPSSVGVITYQETWTIEDAAALPVFTQDDVLGSESAESLEGRTQLRTQEVREGGDLLLGSFDRDGSRRGSFQMRRSGPRKEVGKTSSAEQARRAAARSFLGTDEGKQLLAPLRSELAQRGVELDDAQVQKLTQQIQELFAKGHSAEEVRERLLEEWSKPGGSRSEGSPR